MDPGLGDNYKQMPFLNTAQRCLLIAIYAIGALVLWRVLIAIHWLELQSPGSYLELISVALGGCIAGYFSLLLEQWSFHSYGRWPRRALPFIARVAVLSILWLDVGVILGQVINVGGLIIVEDDALSFVLV